MGIEQRRRARNRNWDSEGRGVCSSAVVSRIYIMHGWIGW